MRQNGLTVREIAARVCPGGESDEIKSTIERIRYWTKIGLLDQWLPEEHSARYTGTGRWRKYPDDIVYAIVVLNELALHDMPLSVLYGVIHELGASLDAPGTRIWKEGKTIRLGEIVDRNLSREKLANLRKRFAKSQRRMAQAIKGDEVVYLKCAKHLHGIVNECRMSYTPVFQQSAPLTVVINLTELFERWR